MIASGARDAPSAVIARAARLALVATAAMTAAACTTPDLDGHWDPADAIGAPFTPIVASSHDAPPPAGHLRIVSFNVELGADVEGLADAIAAAPAIAGADVFLLQEIEDHPTEPGPRALRLADRLGLNVAYAPARREGDGTHGLAILSRYPLADVRVMRLPHVDVTFHTRDRVALAADVVIGDARLAVVDLHLDTRLNITDRIAQAHPAIVDLPARVIVGGDLNVNPYVWLGHVVPLLTAAALDASDQAFVFDDYMRAQGFTSPTSASGPTEASAVTALRLDAIYPRGHAPGATGVAREVQVSDHVPLWLDVAWP